MKTSLDCIPCFLRQTLDAARIVSSNPDFHEHMIRHVVRRLGDMDLRKSPPEMAQHIHRMLREIAGLEDPYRMAKVRLNRMAFRLFPELNARVQGASDSLEMAVRLAIAGNVIDMGVKSDVTEADVRQSLRDALEKQFAGDMELFRSMSLRARTILYLADNAGEIFFDRLLIEQLGPERVILAVRGVPVINDATEADVLAAGLNDIVRVIDNGSDAPGTILSDCSAAFRQVFNGADMIIAKGQGNFESLSDEEGPIFFLFKAKCAVIAAHVGLPAGTHVLAVPRVGQTV